LGGQGSIGEAISEKFREAHYDVWITSRRDTRVSDFSFKITGDPVGDRLALNEAPQFDCVVWAQGANLNDSIVDFDQDNFDSVFSANCTFILSTMNTLLTANKLKTSARLCVVSSIWQHISRTNKLSYGISKSAIAGLVRSCAADLAARGFMVNAVLPGVLDTPMTRSVLTEEQILRVQTDSGFGRLVQPNDVANTVLFLCSELNNAITGQSITVDLGYSNVRTI
jgi:NAD(P)-dependent dehydrogenase (short-subunit alcohol dehydrogenase family)